MNKRSFLQALVAGGGVLLAGSSRLRGPEPFPPSSQPAPAAPLVPQSPRPPAEPVLLEDLGVALENAPVDAELAPGSLHEERRPDISALDETEVDSYLRKIRNFDADFLTDIYVGEGKAALLASTLARLERVQAFVGHGNFNLLGFDEMLHFARNYEAIGDFGKPELDFLEEIFAFDAARYGFFGDKVTREITARVPVRNVEKIPGSGHYLLKGQSLNLYRQIQKDVGQDLLLTSGVRNVVKQMHLFLAKSVQVNGNLSRASRSLAPPGYSYHGIGDFDVGKLGLGEQNFTEHFSSTEEFRRMLTLGYVAIRYTDTNRYGVRYEPWHIKLG